MNTINSLLAENTLENFVKGVKGPSWVMSF
jgi:hypothetical protein